MFAASKSSAVAAVATDPYWSSVSLLTNFENNLSFQDGSTNSLTLTRSGAANPSLSTPFSGVGGSIYCATANDFVTGITADDLSASDWTFEAWVNISTFAASGGTGGNVIISKCVTPTVSNFGELTFGANTAGATVWIRPTTGGTQTRYQATSAITANTWTHVAAVFTNSNSTLKLYKNGTLTDTFTSVTNGGGTTTTRYGIGQYGNGYQPVAFTGFISNARVVKSAVYTTNFTPSTAPLTAITNTSLLVTGTGQGMFDNSTFVDQGPNALTLTATGSPVYSGLSPFGNTYPGSVLFNGNFLSAGTSTAFALGTGDFTIEGWARDSATTALYAQLVGALNVGVGGNIDIYYDGTTKKFSYYGPTGIVITSSTAVTVGAWFHFAAVRSGTTVTIYLNGTSVGTGTDANNVPSTIAMTIGASANNGSASYFVGNISNVRILKGTALYTSTFTPSTTPLTAVTNTSLLVRGDTGAFYDLSNNGNAMSNTGTTAVTTQIKKYGAESVSYTATAYQTVPDAVNLQFSTGDFTLEMWVYRNAAGVLHSLMCKGASTPTGWLLQVNTSNQVVFTVTSTALLTSTTTIGATTWAFVAITRTGTTNRLFVNGNLEATATDGTNFNQTTNLFVGSDRSNANGLNGYLDDIRITKGVARYTANFTPPTTTFPLS